MAEPASDRAVRIILVGGQRLFRDCLAIVLEEHYTVDASFESLDAALEVLDHARPDLILLNVGTTEEPRIGELIDVARAAGVRVIVLGPSNVHDVVLQSLAANPHAYVTRDMPFDDLMRVVPLAAAGNTYLSPAASQSMFSRLTELSQQHRRTSQAESTVLTPREMEILRFISDGLPNRMIADRLCISVHTVKNHVHKILETLRVHSRFEAVAQAHKRHWLQERRGRRHVRAEQANPSDKRNFSK